MSPIETNQEQYVAHLLSVIDELQKDRKARLALVKKNAALQSELDADRKEARTRIILESQRTLERLCLAKENATLKAENAKLKREIAEIDATYGTKKGHDENFVRELSRIL